MKKNLLFFEFFFFAKKKKYIFENKKIIKGGIINNIEITESAKSFNILYNVLEEKKE